MPRSTTQWSSSPERISHHLRSRAATPIDIPKRRRSAADHSFSPDLLFEMSPLSKDSPEVYPAAPSSTISSVNEPFMYRAPPLKPFCPKPQPQHTLDSKNLSSDTSGADFLFAHETESTHLPGKPSPNHGAMSSVNTDLHGVKKLYSTKKFTGFVPLYEHQPPDSDEASKPKRPPLPPPRRSPHSSSPWILAGRSDLHETCAGSYSQADPSAFEFHHHLLRRIENRDSTRLKSLHSCF